MDEERDNGEVEKIDEEKEEEKEEGKDANSDTLIIKLNGIEDKTS